MVSEESNLFLELLDCIGVELRQTCFFLYSTLRSVNNSLVFFLEFK